MHSWASRENICHSNCAMRANNKVLSYHEKKDSPAKLRNPTMGITPGHIKGLTSSNSCRGHCLDSFTLVSLDKPFAIFKKNKRLFK